MNDPIALERGITITTFLLSISDRLGPNKGLEVSKDIRKVLADMKAQQRTIGSTQALVTAEQTRVINAGLANLIAAIDQQTQSLSNEMWDQSARQSGLALLQDLATREQTEAIIAQTARQVEGLAGISSHMGKTNQMLESIASELKVLSKPNLLNQIMGAGALLTNAAAVAQIKRLADETARVADGLDRLADNVYSENSRGDKFPGHVHSYIRSMIEKHQDEENPQYFFVFNQSTTWHPKFDDINRADPLGERFLGYYHDLDVLVDFIVSTARPRLGPDPVIHILMPTIGQLAIIESLTFPEEVGPFRIHGQLGESGLPMVYLCTPLGRDRQILKNIGLLRPQRRWVLYQRVGVCLPIIGQWLSTTLEPVFFEEPLFSGSVGVGSPIYMAAYFQTHPVPPRSLGSRRE